MQKDLLVLLADRTLLFGRLVSLKGNMPKKNKNIKENFQWLELQEGGENDKLFDGVSAGTFVDFYGRRFTISPEILPELVENTLRVIESAKTESGELVGLPIDIANHEQGDSAGWIMGLELDKDRKVIRLLPKWNDLGRNVIANNIRRMFSPVIDLSKNVIMGGTLTNWPASRDGRTLEYLLKPIELSRGVYAMSINKNVAELVDESMNDTLSKISEAFMVQYGTSDWTAYPMDIFDDYIIAKSEGKLWKLGYSIDDNDEVDFDPVGDWVEVKLTYVEASISAANKIENNNEVKKMANKPVAKKEPISKDPKTEALGVVELVSSATEEEIAELAKNPKIAELIKSRSAAAVETQRQADEIAQFSKKITTGEDKAEGLPVPADRLEKHLLSLSVDQQKEAREILEHIVKTGFVSLSEKGHKEIIKGSHPLPKLMAPMLEAHLADGGKVGEFFKLNAAELGNMSDYDLSMYEEIKDK